MTDHLPRRRGLVLYGPPAAGKDTVTIALTALDARYVLFPRLKVGSGKTTGYRMVTKSELEALRLTGDIIWENARYGAVYAVDRSGLRARLIRHRPVVHLGQPAAVEAVTHAMPEADWTVASLHCPRSVAAQRIKHRGGLNLEDRLRAWDGTPPLHRADIRIDTALTTPDRAARIIREAVEQDA